MTAMSCYRWNYVSIRSYRFDTDLGTNTNPGMRTNSGRYPAAESRCVLQEVRLTPLALQLLALASLLQETVLRMLRVSNERR